MQPIEFFERLDEIFLLLINRASCHSLLDPLMLVMRNPLIWIPLYVFVTLFMFVKIGKPGWQFILFSLITVVITESFSTLIKNTVGRLRPFFDANLNGLIRNLVDCDGMYSFPSSVATNYFGLATFWFWALFKVTGKKWKGLWTWASLICYAQIYVGQHFPSDVLAGALLGIIIGIVMAKIFEFAWDSGFDWKQTLSFFKTKNIQPRYKSAYKIE